MVNKTTTISFVLKVDEKGNLKIPKEILKALGKYKYFACIVTPSSQKVRIIPLVGNSLIHLKIALNNIPEHLAEIMNVLLESNIELLFTTGICEEGDVCTWEGFINPIKCMCEDEIEKVRNKLLRMDGVIRVEVNSLSSG